MSLFLYQHNIVLTKRTSNIVDEIAIASNPDIIAVDRDPTVTGYIEMSIGGINGSGGILFSGFDPNGLPATDYFPISAEGNFLGSQHFLMVTGITSSGFVAGTFEAKMKRIDGTPIWMDKNSVTIRCRLREMRVRPNYSLIVAGIATINDLLMYFPRILPEADKPEKGDYFTYSGSQYEVLNTDEINEGGPNLETGVALCRKPKK